MKEHIHAYAPICCILATPSMPMHHEEPKTAVVWKKMITKIGLQKTISLNKYTKTGRMEEWDLIGSKRFLHTTYGPSTLYSDNSAARYSIQDRQQEL
jgi:hypothetical protein